MKVYKHTVPVIQSNVNKCNTSTTIFQVNGIKGVTPDNDIHNDTAEDVNGPSSDHLHNTENVVI